MGGSAKLLPLQIRHSASCGAMSFNMESHADHTLLVEQRTSQLATWPRQARNQTRADRINHPDKHDRDRVRLLLQCAGTVEDGATITSGLRATNSKPGRVVSLHRRFRAGSNG
jgi:hypothetical protein